MTDDGTQGKMLIEKLRGSSIDLLFIKNGVDFVKVNHNIISRDIKDISKSMVNYKIYLKSFKKNIKVVDILLWVMEA